MNNIDFRYNFSEGIVLRLLFRKKEKKIKIMIFKELSTGKMTLRIVKLKNWLMVIPLMEVRYLL